MILSRRHVLRGLIAAPAVIALPSFMRLPARRSWTVEEAERWLYQEIQRTFQELLKSQTDPLLYNDGALSMLSVNIENVVDEGCRRFIVRKNRA